MSDEKLDNKEVVDSEKKNKDEDKKKNNLILILLMLIVIVLLILIAVILLKKPAQGDAGQQLEDVNRETVVNEDNVDEIVDRLHNQETIPNPAPNGYNTKMNAEWTFENGTSSSSNAYVENPEENECSVMFDVYMADTNEVIFQSPILNPGSHITGDMIKLNKDLDPGVYNCVCKYTMITDDGKDSGYTVSLAVTITVLN